MKVYLYEKDNGELNAIVHTGSGQFVCVTHISNDSRKDDILSIVRPTTVGGMLRKNPQMLPKNVVTEDYDIDEQAWYEMASIALDLLRKDKKIATLSPRKTELYLEKMGKAGKRFFGIKEK